MAMGFSDVLWVFLMVTALQPILKQKLLEMRRLRLLVQLEKRRGSRVIALVHRQETMSFLGFPLMRYIDVNDSEERSEEHTSELQSRLHLVCRLLLEKKKYKTLDN